MRIDLFTHRCCIQVFMQIIAIDKELRALATLNFDFLTVFKMETSTTPNGVGGHNYQSVDTIWNINK